MDGSRQCVALCRRFLYVQPLALMSDDVWERLGEHMHALCCARTTIPSPSLPPMHAGTWFGSLMCVHGLGAFLTLDDVAHLSAASPTADGFVGKSQAGWKLACCHCLVAH